MRSCSVATFTAEKDVILTNPTIRRNPVERSLNQRGKAGPMPEIFQDLRSVELSEKMYMFALKALSGRRRHVRLRQPGYASANIEEL